MLVIFHHTFVKGTKHFRHRASFETAKQQKLTICVSMGSSAACLWILLKQ